MFNISYMGHYIQCITELTFFILCDINGGDNYCVLAKYI